MKKHLRAMLEAIISDDTDAASKHLHDYLASKTRGIVLGEKEDKDEEDKEDDEEDKEEKKDSKKSKKKDKDDNEDDDKDEDKEDVKESLASSHPDSYQKNEKGMAYKAVPHKDKSEGYGHEKSKANARKLKADGKSGASEKKGDAMKAPHKDNSRSAKSEDKGAKGLKDAPKGTRSPDGDGKKEDRR